MPNIYYEIFKDKCSPEFRVVSSLNPQHKALYLTLNNKTDLLPIFSEEDEPKLETETRVIDIKNHWTIEKTGHYPFHYTEEHRYSDGSIFKAHVFYSIFWPLNTATGHYSSVELKSDKVSVGMYKDNKLFVSIDSQDINIQALLDNARPYVERFIVEISQYEAEKSTLCYEYATVKRKLDDDFSLLDLEPDSVNFTMLNEELENFKGLLNQKRRLLLPISDCDNFYEDCYAKLINAQIPSTQLDDGTELLDMKGDNEKSTLKKTVSRKKKQKSSSTKKGSREAKKSQPIPPEILEKMAADTKAYREEQAKKFENYKKAIRQANINYNFEVLNSYEPDTLIPYFDCFFNAVMHEEDPNKVSALTEIGDTLFLTVDGYSRYLKAQGRKVREIGPNAYASPLFELFLRNNLTVFEMFLMHGMDSNDSWYFHHVNEQYKKFMLLEVLIISKLVINRGDDNEKLLHYIQGVFQCDIDPYLNFKPITNKKLFNKMLWDAQKRQILNKQEVASMSLELNNLRQQNDMSSFIICQLLKKRDYLDTEALQQFEQAVLQIISSLVIHLGLSSALKSLYSLLSQGILHSLEPSCTHACKVSMFSPEGDKLIDLTLSKFLLKIKTSFQALSFNKDIQGKIIKRLANCVSVDGKEGHKIYDENPLIIAQYLISLLNDPKPYDYNMLLYLFHLRFKINKSAGRVEYGYYRAAYDIIKNKSPEFLNALAAEIKPNISLNETESVTCLDYIRTIIQGLENAKISGLSTLSFMNSIKVKDADTNSASEELSTITGPN